MIPDQARRLTAEELVAAVREGIEARDGRFDTPPVDFPPVELNALVHTESVVDLAETPLPPARPAVRRARAALKRLLAPWTARQTDFNRLIAHLLHHQGVQLAQRFAADRDRLQARIDELTRETFELRHKLDTLAHQGQS